MGEYANLMVKDYDAALQYVHDYFHMEYKKFISTYFKGDKANEIERNLTSQKYKQLFGLLSPRQMEIISDKESRCIVVAAGPGSGKTRVLVHKLASLLLLEDVKHEQLLMLTFSRAAATEFKQRLLDLIGNAAHFVEIKTFHSYSFDLLGRIGNLENVKDVVGQAAEMINQGEVEPNRIGKTVLVIDEAQDMSEAEFSLVQALMKNNEEMRIIAVGDDDQNIYEFRGSNSSYMFHLLQESGSRLIEMTDNYRSSQQVVGFANAFTQCIPNRKKTSPIGSMSTEKGYVEITRYTSANLYLPLVEQLIHNQGKGTACILTQTNEEAVILIALMRKHHIHCKLIQSMEGLRFWNLAEMRYFLKQLDKVTRTPLIKDAHWEQAKQATYTYYQESQSLSYVKRCIELFEQTNKSKYLTDFKEFVFESQMEDFSDTTGADVVVSTIHKAKGREFDDVYMLVGNTLHTNISHCTTHYTDSALMRRYYVGITRAKKRLFLHTNKTCFDSLPVDRYHTDTQIYPMPEEITLQLSHRDVNLGFFKNRKKEILSLKGGSPLLFDEKESILYHPTTREPLAKLSAKMQTTLSEWKTKCYEVKSASVRFIVAWKPKDAPKEESETAVLLADLTLCKS